MEKPIDWYDQFMLRVSAEKCTVPFTSMDVLCNPQIEIYSKISSVPSELQNKGLQPHIYTIEMCVKKKSLCILNIYPVIISQVSSSNIICSCFIVHVPMCVGGMCANLFTYTSIISSYNFWLAIFKTFFLKSKENDKLENAKKTICVVSNICIHTYMCIYVYM